LGKGADKMPEMMDIFNFILWLIVLYFGGIGARTISYSFDDGFSRSSVFVFYMAIIVWLTVALRFLRWE
jgi:hypothetical protein